MFFSALGLRNGSVLWHPALDSHADLMVHAGLPDTEECVKLELTPGSDWLDPDTWKFGVDAPSAPVWCDDDRQAAFASEMRRVARTFIMREGHKRLLVDGCWIVGGTAIVHDVRGGRVLHVGGSARITDVWDAARIANVRGRARITEVRGLAQITDVGGSAQITDVGGSAWIANVGDAARITDVGGEAQIANVWDGAQITKVQGEVQITKVRDAVQITKVGGRARITDVGGSVILDGSARARVC